MHLQGFIQDFLGEGTSSMRKHAQLEGSGGMLPQENFDIHKLLLRSHTQVESMVYS